MKHFLITRFNLRDNRKQHEAVNIGQTKNWLENRISIFEKYCAPSVARQTASNFVWLVLFDTDTPSDFKEKAVVLSKKFNFVLVFVDGFKYLQPSVINFITSNCDNEEFVITTRLDNDDIIHPNFISAIQQAYKPQHLLIIDFPNGFQLHRTTERLNKIYFPFNPFISVVECVSMLQSVISREHLHWREEKFIVSLKNSFWIQLIHESNLANRKHFFFPIVNSLKIREFIAVATIKPEPRLSLFFNTLIFSPIYQLYVIYLKAKRYGIAKAFL